MQVFTLTIFWINEKSNHHPPRSLGVQYQPVFFPQTEYPVKKMILKKINAYLLKKTNSQEQTRDTEKSMLPLTASNSQCWHVYLVRTGTQSKHQLSHILLQSKPAFNKLLICVGPDY